MEVVVFSVGGTRFETTRPTLKQSKLLAEAASGTFFDRSPTAFAIILDYLRTGLWAFPSFLEALVLEEAAFFGVGCTTNLGLRV
jgi:hypothetical protein